MPAPEKVHQCHQYFFNDVAAFLELSEPCSGRPTFVSVMQPAHFSDGDDAASIGELYAAWFRRILLQCEVRASPLIVTDERLKVPGTDCSRLTRPCDRGVRDGLCQ